MSLSLLVTGGSGFIGSALIRHVLACTSHHVTNLDKLTYSGNPASLASLVRALGWQPSVALQQGLSRTIRWYLEHRDWWAWSLNRPGGQ